MAHGGPGIFIEIAKTVVSKFSAGLIEPVWFENLEHISYACMCDMKDDDQEITDEELQRLIDINEADSSEPGGISPQRREKLLKDTENRIASLADFFKPGDIVIDHFEERHAALLQGASADEIDAFTEEYAELNGIDLDVFDEDWIGTERLKIKQISRIENEDEQDAALEALATESVLREDQRKATQPVNTKRQAHREFLAANRSRWPTIRYYLRHPFKYIGDYMDKSIFAFVLAFILYNLCGLVIGCIILVLHILTGISADALLPILVILGIIVAIFYTKFRRKKTNQ